MLQEDKRLQLDGIVNQMTQNLEPTSNIQFVVDDFKKKYDAPQQLQEPDPNRGTPGFFQQIAQSYNTRQSNIEQSIGAEMRGQQTKPETMLQTLGQGAGLVKDVAGAAIGTAAKSVLPSFISKPLGWLGSMAGEAAGVIANQPIGIPGVNIIPGMSNPTPAQIIQGGKQVLDQNPRLARNVGAVGNIADVVGTAAGAGALAKQAPKILSVGKGMAEDALSGAKNLVSKPVSTISKLAKGRTEAEVLATPESQLYKLNPQERSLYFDTQRSQITSRSTALQEQVKQNLQKSAVASQTEAENLTKQLASASRDETLALRPKIQSALGRQSQEYRRLVEEELAPHRNVPVNNSELSQFIDNKYAANPDAAQAVKNKLGIPETSSNGMPVVQVGKTEGGAGGTIGEVYDKAQSLKQDMGTAAAKGTRVYTPDEKLTDDAISSLTDFMKSKGVDLSGARQFWAKYAPVRNQLVTEAKPFLQAPTQTKTFANTLSRVAQGNDVNNENFIREVEKLVGQPLAKEQKGIVAKLSANEKQALSAKIDAETQKAEIAMQKDDQLKGLSSKEFEVNRQATMRKIVRNVLLTAGGLGLNETLKKYTGMGF